MIRLFLVGIVLVMAAGAAAQDLPSSIRGYKVQRAKVQVAVGEQTPGGKADATFSLGEPRMIEAGLTGVTFETTAEVSGMSQNAQIDFISFKDIVVNGIPISADEYVHPFTIRKGETVKLPIPLRGSVDTINIAKAGYSEFTASRPDWRVTGTVFVFGRFKKFGMTFKRVIPVPIDLTIKNPLPAMLGQ